MTAPTIGFRPGGRGVEIDVDALLATRLLVQANSGGGKSFLLRRLLEQTHGKVPHLIMDVEGDFHTLRERYDYVLAGREGADCPAHVAAAPVLARRLMELGVSAIIDISEMSSDVEAPDNRYAFVARFLDALMAAPRSLWHPTLVVIDEAQQFAAEAKDNRKESYAAVVNLATRGRKRGFCAVLATTRLSDLAKAAAAECNNVLVGRTVLDVDQKRAAAALGLSGRTDRIALKDIAPGNFRAFGPAFSISGVQQIHIGEVQTTHPRPGMKATKITPPPEKVRKVLSELAAIPREAEKEAHDLAAAMARIAELQRELRAKGDGGKTPVEVANIVAKHVGDTERSFAGRLKNVTTSIQEESTKILAAVNEAILSIQTAVDRASLAKPFDQKKWHDTTPDPIDDLAAAKRAVLEGRSPSVTAHVDVLRKTIAIEKGPDEKARRTTADGTEIDGGMHRVIDALAWLEAANVPKPYERAQVAALADYALGGTFNGTASRCSVAGLITYPSPGEMELTDAGRAVAAWPKGPIDFGELQERLLNRIDGGMKRVLEPLLRAYPKAMTREELAPAANYEPGGTFNGTVSRISVLGAVTYPSKGVVRAAPWLFLEK